jgi:Mg2+ transporter MgtE
MNWIFTYKLPDQFVSWKYVQQLPSGTDHIGLVSLKLKTACQPLTTLHPADLSEILMDLNRYERIALFRSLDSKTAAEVLAELKSDIQKRLLENLEREKRYEVISQMLPDKAADLLSHLPPKRREDIMKHLPQSNTETIKGLLVHPEETAGSIMTTQFVTMQPEITVDEAINKLKEFASKIQSLYYVYVVDANQILLGVVTMRRLMASLPAAKLSEIMNTKVVKVKPNTEEKKITRTFIKYNFGAIPVVDSHNKLLGIIMFKDAVDKVLSAIAKKGI